MRNKNEQARQLMGCGYAPPPAERLRPYVESGVWDGRSLGRVVRPDEMDENRRVLLPVCPGYVCTLPEVYEATWAHRYAERGELTQFCEGQSTPHLRAAMDEYDVEVSRMTSWATRNPVKEQK